MFLKPKQSQNLSLRISKLSTRRLLKIPLGIFHPRGCCLLKNLRFWNTRLSDKRKVITISNIKGTALKEKIKMDLYRPKVSSRDIYNRLTTEFFSYLWRRQYENIFLMSFVGIKFHHNLLKANHLMLITSTENVFLLSLFWTTTSK